MAVNVFTQSLHNYTVSQKSTLDVQNLRSCIATSATFRQPTPAHCASLSTQQSTRTAVGLFQSLVRRSGTHCQMNSEIRCVMSTASNSSLKQSCSALTCVTNALEVIFNVMRSTNPRFTYLLTYYVLCDAVQKPNTFATQNIADSRAVIAIVSTEEQNRSSVSTVCAYTGIDIQHPSREYYQ